MGAADPAAGSRLRRLLRPGALGAGAGPGEAEAWTRAAGRQRCREWGRPRLSSLPCLPPGWDPEKLAPQWSKGRGSPATG